MLAGGLNPSNVRAAIRAVGPAAVDAHTGVEGPNGRKSRILVERFVSEARCGFDSLADPVTKQENNPRASSNNLGDLPNK
jgi:phosphoribosylanthranilate isomerase